MNKEIDINKQYKRIAELEEQLKEKEKEIERLKVYDEYRFELPYPNVKILGKTFEDIQELLDKWLKQGSKDKISFAVDKLVGVQKYISDNAICVEQECFGREINEYIDKQIKELKEGK